LRFRSFRPFQRPTLLRSGDDRLSTSRGELPLRLRCVRRGCRQRLRLSPALCPSTLLGFLHVPSRGSTNPDISRIFLMSSETAGGRFSTGDTRQSSLKWASVGCVSPGKCPREAKLTFSAVRWTTAGVVPQAPCRGLGFQALVEVGWLPVQQRRFAHTCA